MNKIYVLLVIFICSISFPLFADESEESMEQMPQVTAEQAIAAMSEMIMSTPLTKQEMQKIIEQMAKAKQITAEEAQNTKKMLDQMSDKDMAQMKQVMVQMMTKQLKAMKHQLPKTIP